MKLSWTLAIGLTAAAASAQVSSEEAYARLRAKQARQEVAASQAATSQPVESIEQLREEVSQLRKLVAILEQDNTELRARLGLGKKDKSADKVPDEMEREALLGKLAVGMTLKQARTALRSEGVLLSESATEQMYEFHTFLPIGDHGVRPTYLVRFVDGKVNSYSRY